MEKIGGWLWFQQSRAPPEGRRASPRSIHSSHVFCDLHIIHRFLSWLHNRVINHQVYSYIQIRAWDSRLYIFQVYVHMVLWDYHTKGAVLFLELWKPSLLWAFMLHWLQVRESVNHSSHTLESWVCGILYSILPHIADVLCILFQDDESFHEWEYFSRSH